MGAGCQSHRPSPHYKPYTKVDMNQDADLRKLASANTRIRISSNLPGLLAHMGDVSVDAETRLRSSEIRYRGNGEPFPPTIEVHNPDPVAQRKLADGRELYMNTPPSRRWTGNPRDSSLNHEWQVRAQLRLALDTGEKKRPTRRASLAIPGTADQKRQDGCKQGTRRKL